MDSCSGRLLYRTAIDNIRLSGCLTALSDGDAAAAGASRQRAGVAASPGTEAPRGVTQLDDLISSLIEIAVDVDSAQTLPQQPSRVHHGVLSAARY